jgi:hypothetical protein
MKIFIHIVVTFVLMFWPIMFMMSPMAFDAPGSDNNKGNIVGMMLTLCYPIGLFLILGMFGVNYFGVNSFKLALISTAIILIAFSLFGYFGLLSNALRGIANSGYSVVGETVYNDGKPIEGADGKTFKILDSRRHSSRSHYALDKNHLYYDGKIVEDALAEDIVEAGSGGSDYFRNSQQVIYRDMVLQGAVADRFAVFDRFTDWAYSASEGEYNVYYRGVLLPTVERDAFAPLNDFFATDKKRIFEGHTVVLMQADAASFELMSDHDFGKDNNHVYYLGVTQPIIVQDADPVSFEVLERGYARDRNHVFVIEQYTNVVKLEQADIDTFEVTRYDDATKSEARDVNHYYYGGKIVGTR